jgi:hypothetical protein
LFLYPSDNILKGKANIQKVMVKYKMENLSAKIDSIATNNKVVFGCINWKLMNYSRVYVPLLCPDLSSTCTSSKLLRKLLSGVTNEERVIKQIKNSEIKMRFYSFIKHRFMSTYFMVDTVQITRTKTYSVNSERNQFGSCRGIKFIICLDDRNGHQGKTGRSKWQGGKMG